MKGTGHLKVPFYATLSRAGVPWQHTQWHPWPNPPPHKTVDPPPPLTCPPDWQASAHGGLRRYLFHPQPCIIHTVSTAARAAAAAVRVQWLRRWGCYPSPCSASAHHTSSVCPSHQLPTSTNQSPLIHIQINAFLSRWRRCKGVCVSLAGAVLTWTAKVCQVG